jgi:hypothetical protein
MFNKIDCKNIGKICPLCKKGLIVHFTGEIVCSNKDCSASIDKLRGD